MNNRDVTALVALRQILRATDANVRALAAKSGLTTSQLLALQILEKQGETPAGDLARAVKLRQATMSVLLDKLQARGLITRARSQRDKRRVWVNITPAGLNAIAGAPDLLQEVFLRRFNRLEDWEQANLIAALERISAMLDAEQIDASPLLDIGAVNQLPDATLDRGEAAKPDPGAPETS